jgi:hypothetical protein
MTQKLVKLFAHIGYNETNRCLLLDRIIYNQNIRSIATECYLGCIQGTKKSLTRHLLLKFSLRRNPRVLPLFPTGSSTFKGCGDLQCSSLVC